MDNLTVEIPLRLAQRAMRFFRPLIPFVKKRVAELQAELRTEAEQEVEEVKIKTTKGRKKAKE